LPVFSTQRRVEFRDTDAAGIVHFSVFFTYMEAAEQELLRSRGLSVVMSDEEGPLAWPRVAAHCDYHSSIRFEDLVDIEVQISRVGGKSVTFGFYFTSAGRDIARGEITAVCCRANPDGSLRSITIPSSVAAKLRE
jgi:4-hydroxybenzoyl-CoA thioesterase/acyl-CoA thioester hydrolase